MSRWLRRLWRARQARAGALAPAARLMLVDDGVRRMMIAAEREGMKVGDFDDALTLLAEAYPVTKEHVLTVVEQVGLARAHAQLEMCHGDP